MPQSEARRSYFPCSLPITIKSKCDSEMLSMTGPQSHHILEQTVMIKNENIVLGGFLGLPFTVSGIVLFAHGSGSGRFSPRNRFVAEHLQQGGIATLLIDLLMPDEGEDRRNVFDIDLLADRV